MSQMSQRLSKCDRIFTLFHMLRYQWSEVKMAWATKRPANEPLAGLFAGPLTARFYLCLFLGR